MISRGFALNKMAGVVLQIGFKKFGSTVVHGQLDAKIFQYPVLCGKVMKVPCSK